MDRETLGVEPLKSGGVSVDTSDSTKGYLQALDGAVDSRWVVHGERPVYESEWVRVGLADLSQPSGARFEHHTVWFPPVAMAVLFDDSRENVLLSWRHRFAPDIWNWEIPGGIIDGEENPRDTIARELVEETGYGARQLEHLITFEPAVGMLRNPNHIFVGYGARQIGAPSERNEGNFEWVPYTHVPGLITSGKVANSGALVGLMHVLAISGR